MFPVNFPEGFPTPFCRRMQAAHERLSALIFSRRQSSIAAAEVKTCFSRAEGGQFKR
jgi:hypothetical protein